MGKQKLIKQLFDRINWDAQDVGMIRLRNEDIGNKLKVGDKIVNYFYEIGVILEVSDSKYLCQFGNRKDWLEEDDLEVINE